MYIENVRSVVRRLNLTQPLTPSLKNQRRGIDSTSKLEISIIIGVITFPVVHSLELRTAEECQ
jgi:hypothetical protein